MKTSLYLLALLVLCSVAGAQVSFLVNLDLESGTMDGFRSVSVNPMPVITTEKARVGRYAAKAFLNSADPDPERRERVEMAVERSANLAEIGKMFRYGWSLYLPDPYPVDSLHWEILSQFHQVNASPGEMQGRNPALDFGIHKNSNRWTIHNRADPRVLTTDKAGIIYKTWDAGLVETGVWTDWQMRVRWSYESDGVLQIYKNGKLVVDHRGPNCYNDLIGPQWKSGIYKANWKLQAPDPSVKTRLIYVDSLRMAAGDGPIEEVMPAAGSRPKPPTLLQVN